MLSCYRDNISHDLTKKRLEEDESFSPQSICEILSNEYLFYERRCKKIKSELENDSWEKYK